MPVIMKKLQECRHLILQTKSIDMQLISGQRDRAHYQRTAQDAAGDC